MLQALHEGVGLVGPDVAEATLAHVAEAVVLPELVRMDVAEKIDVADPHSRGMRTAAVPLQEVVYLPGLCGFFIEKFPVHVHAVNVVVHGEDVDVQSPGKVVRGTRYDDVKGVPGLPVGEVVLEHVLPPAGVYQVVEACTANVFLFNEVEDAVKVAVIVFRQRQPQSHALSHGDAVFKALHGFAVRSLHAAEFIVHLLHAVKAYPHVSDAGVLDPLRGVTVNQGAVCGDDRAYAFVRCPFNEGEEVFPHERLTAGKKKRRNAEGGKVVNEGKALIGGEFPGVAGVVGVGVAVDAPEITGAGGAPHHNGFSLPGVQLPHVGAVAVAVGFRVGAVPEAVPRGGAPAVEFSYINHAVPSIL